MPLSNEIKDPLICMLKKSNSIKSIEDLPLPQGQFLRRVFTGPVSGNNKSVIDREIDLSFVHTELLIRPTQIWNIESSQGGIVITAPAKEVKAPYVYDKFSLGERQFVNTICSWSLEDCLSALAQRQETNKLDEDVIYLIPYGLCQQGYIASRAHLVLIVIVNSSLYLLNSQPQFMDFGYTSNLTEICDQFGLTYHQPSFLRSAIGYFSAISHWINYSTQGLLRPVNEPAPYKHSLFDVRPYLDRNCPFYVLKLIQLFLFKVLKQEDFLDENRQGLLDKLTQYVNTDNVVNFKTLWVDGNADDFSLKLLHEGDEDALVNTRP